MRLLVCTVVAAVVSLGCGGDSFGRSNGQLGSGGTAQTGGAPSNGGASSGGTSSGGNTGNGGTANGGVTGNGGAGTGGAGTGGAGGSTGCDSLPAVPTDIYVDHGSTANPPTGTSACPFPMIRQAIAAATGIAGPITIHVAGGTPQVVYAETGPVLVGGNRTLLGAGPAFVKITASGSCGPNGVNCAVGVDGNGVVDGFTVTCPAGHGLVTNNLTPAPILRNTIAEGSSMNGVLAAGPIELGPSFSATGNGLSGVQSPATASGLVHVVGDQNAFDGNAGIGLNIEGAATLNFEGGTASRNAHGIRLGGIPTASTGSHSIVGLSAEANAGAGVVCENGPTLKMRSSSLLANQVGMIYTYVTAGSATLDIGNDPTASAGNIFGGATAASNNTLAGIRLCNAGGDASLPALGNGWKNCPPVQTLVYCDQPINAYTDVAYGTAILNVTGPVAATTCAVGP